MFGFLKRRRPLIPRLFSDEELLHRAQLALIEAQKAGDTEHEASLLFDIRTLSYRIEYERRHAAEEATRDHQIQRELSVGYDRYFRHK